MSAVNKENLRFEELQHVYFLGIGGIGMSAIARYFKLQGKTVSGYDKTSTNLTKKLEDEGMDIHYKESPELIPENIDLIIYTPAIPKENREWAPLREKNVPLMKRAEVLGLISKSYKTIAVAGTHGKTSTSSMASYFLRAGGIDATAFLGGIVKEYGSNFVFGESEWVVVEADEFDRSFMHLYPELAILLSMDPDHLDIYGDHQEMLRTFRDFTMNIRPGGKLLVAQDLLCQIDLEWRKMLLEQEIELYSFGIESAWYTASNLKAINHQFEFDFAAGGGVKHRMALTMPGNHNVSNATAALGVCEIVGADFNKIKGNISEFKGVLRRFDFIVKSEEAIYIDDYAHHPSEIRAAILAARTLYPERKLTVVFQPHLFSRTKDFMDGFAEELSKADELILMEIYPAREKPIEGINTLKLMELITLEDVWIGSEKEIVKHFQERENKPALLMTLGAGNIDRLVKPLGEIIAKK